MRKLSTFTVLVLILSSSSSVAAPQAKIEYLINQPASLFDIGMLRLELYLEVAEKRLENGLLNIGYELESAYGGATFDYQRKIILTEAFVKVKNHRATEDRCELVVRKWRQAVFPDSLDMATFFEVEFGHKGYVRRSQPDGMGEAIVSSMEVHVSLTDFAGERKSCWTKSRGNEIYITRE